MPKKPTPTEAPDPTEPPTEPDPTAPADDSPVVGQDAPAEPPPSPPPSEFPSGQALPPVAPSTPEIGVQPVSHAVPAVADPTAPPEGATPGTHVLLIDKRGVESWHPAPARPARTITVAAPATDPAPAVRLAGRKALPPTGDCTYERTGERDGFLVYTQPEF